MRRCVNVALARCVGIEAGDEGARDTDERKR